MTIEILSHRAVSTYPLSVGTSLAIESIAYGNLPAIDPDRKVPQVVSLRNYQEFWINVSTLFRNLISAIPSSDVEHLDAEECAKVLCEEMFLLEKVTGEQSNNLTKTVFYICEYKGLESKFKHAILRKYRTDKQKQYKLLHDITTKFALDEYHVNSENKVNVFDVDLFNKKYTDALIMTHVPLDLTNVHRFRSLELLESHTGSLKNPSLWYQKYYKGKELAMIPFNRVLLQIFGDNEMFHPQSNVLRNIVINKAKEKKWNFTTSLAKVMTDSQTIHNPMVRDLFTKAKVGH